MNTLLIIGITTIVTASLYSIVLIVIKMNKKMKDLGIILKNFPSPEDMAKQILKVKLPLQDLPPELQKKALENLMQHIKKDGVLIIYDLKRVWWLYCIKKQSGFFKSIRASYKPNEIRKMLESIGVKKYEISNIFPYFLQNVIIWK